MQTLQSWFKPEKHITSSYSLKPFQSASSHSSTNQLHTARAAGGRRAQRSPAAKPRSAGGAARRRGGREPPRRRPGTPHNPAGWPRRDTKSRWLESPSWRRKLLKGGLGQETGRDAEASLPRAASALVTAVTNQRTASESAWFLLGVVCAEILSQRF